MMMDFNDSDTSLVTSDLLLLKLMELYPDLQIDENNISIAINQVSIHYNHTTILVRYRFIKHTSNTLIFKGILQRECCIKRW